MANLDLSARFSSDAVKTLNTQLLQGAANAEVYQGLYLGFELLLPSRNLMLLMMWWQYLQMRYISDNSGQLKQAFANLDQRVSALLTHPMCPGAVRAGYAWIRTFCKNKVDMVSFLYYILVLL